MRTDFLGIYYGTTNFEIRSSKLPHFNNLLKATKAPSPRMLSVKVKRHYETFYFEGGYDSLLALQFQYQHPDCKVEVLAGVRNKYVGAWELLRNLTDQDWRRGVLSAAVSEVVLGRSSRISVVLRLANVPSWGSQERVANSNIYSLPIEVQTDCAKMLDLPEGTRIDYTCMAT